MTLGIFLPLGGSLTDLEKNGKLGRFRDYYLSAYSQEFAKVYIFSYEDESRSDLSPNCVLIPNRFRLHRYLYAFAMPLLNRDIIETINVARVMQLDGVIPAVMSKLVRNLRVKVTYGYDYKKVALLNKNYLAWGGYWLLERLIFSFVDGIIFPSKTIMGQFSRLKNALYLPNGIDTSRFRPLPRQKSRVTQVLTQSRLTPEKRLNYLVKSAEGIPNVELTIVGDGPLYDRIFELAKQCKVKLTIIRKVPNSNMPKVYNQSDIFILSSVTEGSPKALLEAAACGCAIVASDIPQVREILGKKAALYFKNNLKERINFLLANPKLQKDLGEKARKIITRHFDIHSLLKEEVLWLKKGS